MRHPGERRAVAVLGGQPTRQDGGPNDERGDPQEECRGAGPAALVLQRSVKHQPNQLRQASTEPAHQAWSWAVDPSDYPQAAAYLYIYVSILTSQPANPPAAAGRIGPAANQLARLAGDSASGSARHSNVRQLRTKWPLRTWTPPLLVSSGSCMLTVSRRTPSMSASI